MSDRELRDALERTQAELKLLKQELAGLRERGEVDEVLDRVDELQQRMAALQAENDKLRAHIGGHDVDKLMTHVGLLEDQLLALEDQMLALKKENAELKELLGDAMAEREELLRRREQVLRELDAALVEQQRLRHLLETMKDERRVLGLHR